MDKFTCENKITRHLILRGDKFAILNSLCEFVTMFAYEMESSGILSCLPCYFVSMLVSTMKWCRRLKFSRKRVGQPSSAMFGEETCVV